MEHLILNDSKNNCMTLSQVILPRLRDFRWLAAMPIVPARYRAVREKKRGLYEVVVG